MSASNVRMRYCLLLIYYSFSIQICLILWHPPLISIDFSTHLTSEFLLKAVRQAGVATSAELQRRIGKSQPTISRWLRESDADIVRLGQGRGARYAVPDLIWGLPARQPLYWNGSERWGTLTFLAGNRIHVVGPKIDQLTHGELPWFLDNFRLEGYLGRAWAKTLAFDHNPENWSLAQILYANCQFACDPPGAISIGEPKGEPVISAPSSRRGRFSQMTCHWNVMMIPDARRGDILCQRRGPPENTAGNKPASPRYRAQMDDKCFPRQLGSDAAVPEQQ